MATQKQHLSAHVARAVRYGDVEGERTARRNLAEAQIAIAIDKALASAPPLTPAQIKTLTGLLRTGSTK